MGDPAHNLHLVEEEHAPAETVEPQGSSTHKTILLSGFAGLMFAVMCYLSYEWFVYSTIYVSTNNSYIEAEMWPVNCRMMGFVRAVHVKENEKVHQGQLLVEFDDADLQIEQEVKSARLRKARADVARARELAKSHVLSKAELENAEAMLAGAEADMHATDLKMKFTKIVAPADGVVTKQNLHSGQFVQPGQSLMLIVGSDRVWVKANFKETQMTSVRVGMPVEVTVDTYPGTIWRGRVESVFPSSGSAISLIPPENATGNFTKITQRIPVLISIEQKAGFDLRPGMSTVARIHLAAP